MYLFSSLYISSLFLLIQYTCASIFHKNNPETGMSVPDIIKFNGYPAEIHQVTTEDGYILELHRIPHNKGEPKSLEQRPVIFLQHGLLCSSADWVVNPAESSLGFMLSDAGFDVWLGNSRGNTYSKKHTTIPIDSDEFWRFSWDDMASKDLPTVIDYIKQNTSVSQIYYTGHSQGTMIAFAGFSKNQELAKSIKKFYGLAPVAYLGNMKSPLKYLASVTPELKFIFEVFGIRDFLPQSWIITWLASHLCTKPALKDVCANVVFVICGYDKPQMNETRLDVYMTHAPAGTSVQNIVHYAQAYKSARFQMYDWGKSGNLKHYNQTTPPQYDLSDFHVPTTLYSGGNDWLADPKDVQRLLKGLPRGVVESRKVISDWMHLDFIWGIDAPQEVYKNLIQDALEDVKESKMKIVV